MLNNAVKYMNRAGTIQIIASYFDDVLKVDIIDEGDGFDHDAIDHLFFDRDRLASETI